MLVCRCLLRYLLYMRGVPADRVPARFDELLGRHSRQAVGGWSEGGDQRHCTFPMLGTDSLPCVTGLASHTAVPLHRCQARAPTLINGRPRGPLLANNHPGCGIT